MQFYPEGATVPQGLTAEEFKLRPLRESDAEIDYAALMDSKSMLRLMSQSGWPEDDFTIEKNRKDLREHEKEHDEGTAFTYTVLDPTESTCLGCVYIEHLKEGPMKGDYVAMLRFWVRQSHLDRDLDRLLLKHLIDWFKDEWAFSRVIFSVADADKRQVQLATESSLQLVHAYGNKWSEFLLYYKIEEGGGLSPTFRFHSNLTLSFQFTKNRFLSLFHCSILLFAQTCRLFSDIIEQIFS